MSPKSTRVPAETLRYADVLPSPLGDLWVVVDGDGALVQLDFDEGRNAPFDRQDLEERYAERDLTLRWSRSRLRHVATALRRTFRGGEDAERLAVAPEGTPFQERVWRTLRRIPRGRTWTYAQLARRVGRPGAARAVGAANGANPISIAIPCHRVVGSDGRLTGYSGGLERKRALLRKEGALV